MSYAPFPNPPIPPGGVNVAFQPAFQFPAFQGGYDFSQEYGYARVVVLAQNAVQPARATFIAGSACRVQVWFYDIDGNPFVPYQVQWRTDDWPSEDNVLWWQPVPLPGLTNTVTVPSRWNALISFSRESETRNVIFRIADWTGNVFYANAMYDLVRELGGITVRSWGFEGQGAFQSAAFQTGDSPADN